MAIESVGGSLREFFLLREAVRNSEKLQASQLERVQRYASAARRRFLVARELRDPRETHAALSLCRSAALLHVLAFLASLDEGLDVETLPREEALARFDQAAKEGKVTMPPEYAVAKDLVAAADPVAVEALTVKEARRALEDLVVATGWLGTLVEPRSVAHLRLTRRVRLSLAVLATLGVAVWLGMRLVSPKNVALHATVHASSTNYGTDPKGAVDGELTGTFGFHSQQEDGPWLAIDLEHLYRLNTIKVFGRGDCCFDQSLPLELEVSDDGQTYRKIGQRDTAISEDGPWVLTATGTTARFVRVRSVGHSSFLVLGEVEVYGQRAK